MPPGVLNTRQVILLFQGNRDVPHGYPILCRITQPARVPRWASLQKLTELSSLGPDRHALLAYFMYYKRGSHKCYRCDAALAEPRSGNCPFRAGPMARPAGVPLLSERQGLPARE